MTPRHTLHIVSGKGGTGKTTIAGALACALATSGRRVLVCEVEGRHGTSELFDVPPREGEQGEGWAMDEPSRAGRYARRLWDGLRAREELIDR